MKQMASEIYEAAKRRKLPEPFNAEMVRKACPGWSKNSYSAFLPKHAYGNPGGNTELFVKVRRGFYRIIDYWECSICDECGEGLEDRIEHKRIAHNIHPKDDPLSYGGLVL